MQDLPTFVLQLLELLLLLLVVLQQLLVAHSLLLFEAAIKWIS
jgi:hypothetical protein